MNHPLEFAALFKLPLAERLQLVEDLWDSIAADAHDDMPLNQPVHQELIRRMEHLDAHPESGLSWDEVRARMRTG